MKVLEVRSVSKSYSQHKALDDVSLSVPEGQIFGLLGPNGAGKTSLIRIVNQITMPDRGDLLFNGDSLCSNHIKAIGYLSEERGLYKKMKVGEQALYLAQLKGISERQAKAALKDWFIKFVISSKEGEAEISSLNSGELIAVVLSGIDFNLFEGFFFIS